tara:strand:- start:494 stop:1030 length:537 start_codon:yes stop_codon:yes gene_type:complete
MKKFLVILVTVLLWCNTSYAELITLTKCFPEKTITRYYTSYLEPKSETSTQEFKNYKEWRIFTKNRIENILYTLDTVEETITRTFVNSEEGIKYWLKYDHLVEKFEKDIFKIIDLGGNVATAEAVEKKNNIKEYRIDVDFVSNKVYSNYMKLKEISKGYMKTNSSATYQCLRQENKLN